MVRVLKRFDILKFKFFVIILHFLQITDKADFNDVSPYELYVDKGGSKKIGSAEMLSYISLLWDKIHE